MLWDGDIGGVVAEFQDHSASRGHIKPLLAPSTKHKKVDHTGPRNLFRDFAPVSSASNSNIHSRLHISGNVLI